MAAATTSLTTGRDQRVGRLVHLDNLKIALTVGVIVAHAAMSYGAVGSWVYEEPSLSEPGEAVLGSLVIVGGMFGLGLFFLMAGFLTTGPLRRRGPARFLLARLGRLGPPLAGYALVVWPVLRWVVQRVENDGRSFFTFYHDELLSSNWSSAGTGPLWFVAVLLIATVVWSLWRWVHPVSAPARPGRLRPRHLAVAAAVVAAGSFLIRLQFPVDSAQFLDLHLWLWPQSMTLFVLGAVGAERGWLGPVTPDVTRACRRLTLVAVAAVGLLVAFSSSPEEAGGGWRWEAATLAAVEGAVSVSVSVLVLDWFRRNQARSSPRRQRLAQAAYGAFVAQGPVLVLIALALRSADLLGDVKFVILAPSAVIVSFGLVMFAHGLTDRV